MLESDDKSKYDYRYQLSLLAFGHRITSGLCIYCGLVAVVGACDNCKEAKRKERIAKYGGDYMEEGTNATN